MIPAQVPHPVLGEYLPLSALTCQYESSLRSARRAHTTKPKPAPAASISSSQESLLLDAFNENSTHS